MIYKVKVSKLLAVSCDLLFYLKCKRTRSSVKEYLFPLYSRLLFIINNNELQIIVAVHLIVFYIIIFKINESFIKNRQDMLQFLQCTKNSFKKNVNPSILNCPLSISLYATGHSFLIRNRNLKKHKIFLFLSSKHHICWYHAVKNMIDKLSDTARLPSSVKNRANEKIVSRALSKITVQQIGRIVCICTQAYLIFFSLMSDIT